MNAQGCKLSIVAACHNEQQGIEKFHLRVSEAAAAVAGHDYELIVVNDGSRDASWTVLCALAARDPRLVLVNLSRRYGQQLALSAGLELSCGERVLTIDADLQDPPELLQDMWQIMDKAEVDVVYGLRSERMGETRFKRTSASLFYWLLQRIGDAEIPRNVGDFRLMSRRVVDILNSMPEQQRFLRGMVSWIGFQQVPIRYDRKPRAAGSSHYPLSRMILLALDALTGFSTAPLRVASYLGFLVGGAGFLMLIYTLGSWATGQAVSGWTSMTTIMLILGSLQLVLLGVLGEYLGRSYIESKRRPLFIIDEIVTKGDRNSKARRPEKPHNAKVGPRKTRILGRPNSSGSSNSRSQY
jgi:polyisoprenyl-phosphate glycosyltransferase